MFSNKSFKALTLAEIMISIGLMMIMMGILLPYYNSLRREFNLLRAAHKLSQDIRRTREMSVSAHVLSDTVYGYGVYFPGEGSAANYYLIYADRNNNQRYNHGGDILIERVDLPEGIYIRDLSGAGVFLSVNFVGPAPTVFIFSPGQRNHASVSLGIVADVSKEETVQINAAGLVYVER